MITPFSPDLYTSSLLSSIPNTIHGFTTRHLGDVRISPVVNKLLKTLELTDHPWVMGEQVHGSRVAFVTGVAPQEHIAGVDGVMFDAKTFSNPPVAAVRVADCAPVLFVDPVHKLYGVAHAGWKGTLGQIVCRMIEVMQLHGSVLSDIRVAIGPCIGACCYTVDEERAKLFRDQFGESSGVVSSKDGMQVVDLAVANELLLKNQGLAADQIDTAALCTASDTKTWYSYRKDTKETFGEIAGFITMNL